MNSYGEVKYYLAVKHVPPLLRGITSKHHGVFIFEFILLQEKTNMNLIKKYVKIKVLYR